MVAEDTVGWWRLRDKLLRWVTTVWSVRPVVLIWSPPSPVESAERVIVVFPTRSHFWPLHVLSQVLVNKVRIAPKIAQAQLLPGKPAGQVHWCQSRAVEQVGSRVRTAAKEHHGL